MHVYSLSNEGNDRKRHIDIRVSSDLTCSINRRIEASADSASTAADTPPWDDKHSLKFRDRISQVEYVAELVGQLVHDGFTFHDQGDGIDTNGARSVVKRQLLGLTVTAAPPDGAVENPAIETLTTFPS